MHEFAYILKGKCDYHRLKQTVTAYKCQKYCKGNKNTFLDVTYVLVLKEHFCAVHIEVHIYENIFFILFLYILFIIHIVKLLKMISDSKNH